MNRRFQINDQIGDYRVLDFIGQGGMGEVYHALHEKLNRSAAMKVLGSRVGLEESSQARFLNEARLQASLHHPNIAALYDFQAVGDELLIFMEFIDGESLESLIEQRFFSVEESLKVFESIVEAIAFVHANGIIHRDIKAENVKLSANCIPKLLDFGIAKDPQSENLTQVGGVIGTPNYLAPEQLEGRPATVQTDIWSLGILLYKMLTGRVPFQADLFDTLLTQIRRAKFEAPENVNLAIPKAVSEIIKKCLSKDLNQRYQTAEELLQDVKRVLNERYSEGKFVDQSRKAEVFSVANVSMIALPILLFLSLVVVGIWAISGSPSEKAEVKETPVREKAAENLNKNVSIEKKSEPKIAQSSSEKNKKTVRIDAIGGSAEVYRNGQKIGNTPFDLDIAENEVVNLKLRREGFLDYDVPIELTPGKKVYTFSLNPK